MKLEHLIPQVKTTFQVTDDLETIHQKLNQVTEEIGLSYIEADKFYYTRLKNRSNAYRIIGNIEPKGSGYEIRYIIRMHHIIQFVYWIGFPVGIVAFFAAEKETFSELLHLTEASIELRFFVHVLATLLGMAALYLMFQHDMNYSDKVIRKVFGKQGAGRPLFVEIKRRKGEGGEG